MAERERGVFKPLGIIDGVIYGPGYVNRITMTFRLSAELKDQIQADAEKQGLTIGQWVQEAVYEKLGIQPHPR